MKPYLTPKEVGAVTGMSAPDVAAWARDNKLTISIGDETLISVQKVLSEFRELADEILEEQRASEDDSLDPWQTQDRFWS